MDKPNLLLGTEGFFESHICRGGVGVSSLCLTLTYTGFAREQSLWRHKQTETGHRFLVHSRKACKLLSLRQKLIPAPLFGPSSCMLGSQAEHLGLVEKALFSFSNESGDFLKKQSQSWGLNTRDDQRADS